MQPGMRMSAPARGSPKVQLTMSRAWVNRPSASSICASPESLSACKFCVLTSARKVNRPTTTIVPSSASQRPGENASSSDQLSVAAPGGIACTGQRHKAGVAQSTAVARMTSPARLRVRAAQLHAGCPCWPHPAAPPAAHPAHPHECCRVPAVDDGPPVEASVCLYVSLVLGGQRKEVDLVASHGLGQSVGARVNEAHPGDVLFRDAHVAQQLARNGHLRSGWAWEWGCVRAWVSRLLRIGSTCARWQARVHFERPPRTHDARQQPSESTHVCARQVGRVSAVLVTIGEVCMSWGRGVGWG